MRRRRYAAAAVASVAAVATLASCAGNPADHKGYTLGLTYTPNIQFAPFYVAEQKGYYKSAGLTVTLRHHGASEQLFGAMKSGKENLIYAGGDEMLQGRAEGVPVVDVATLYQQYPVALIVPKGSDIHSVADMKGKTIGTPAKYGETYFALLALLKQAGLSAQDTKIKYIGFTQQAALKSHRVDGVMGYLNNDAVSFKESGMQVRTLPLKPDGESDTLVGSGLGVDQGTLKKHGDDINAFVDASLRGVQFVIDHPDEAVDLSEKYVPGLKEKKQRDDALAVLKATIPLLKSKDGNNLGYNDPQEWSDMSDFMYDQGLLDKSVTPEEAYDNNYLPKS